MQESLVGTVLLWLLVLVSVVLPRIVFGRSQRERLLELALPLPERTLPRSRKEPQTTRLVALLSGRPSRDEH